MKVFAIITILLFPIISFGSEQDVSDAKEAAPVHITQDASFLIWSGDKYITATSGSNGFICLVLKDPKGRFEPSCLNKAAAESVLPVYEYQTNLLQDGEDILGIYKKIEERFKKGEFLPPAPGAIVYMMSKHNKFYNHFESKLVDVAPHIMLYFPKLDKQATGLNGKNGLPGLYNEYPHLSVIHIHTK